MTRIVTAVSVVLFLVGMTRAADPQLKDKEPAKKLSDAERKELEAEWLRLSKAGQTAYQKGDHKRALESVENALAVARQLYPNQDFPNGHENLAVGLDNLGFILRALGKDSDAEPVLREAVSVYRRLYPDKDDPHLAKSLNSLASALRARGKLADAEPVYRDALDMYKRLYPKQDHRDISAVLGNLGLLFLDQGRAVDAEPVFREALEVDRRVHLKRDHPDVAYSLNNLADVLRELGRPADAEPFARDSVAMRRRLYPKQDHPELAASLNNLALILKEMGRTSDAGPIAREVLDMQLRLYPKQDHPAVALGLANLGIMVNSWGKPEDAEPLFRDALAMLKRLHPKQDHPAVAACTTKLAGLLLAMRKHAEAEPLAREALEMNERLYPKKDHPATAESHAHLADALMSLGKLTEAEQSLRAALDMWRKLYPNQDHPDVAFILSQMGLLLHALGKSGDAEPLLRDALAMRRRLTSGLASQKAEGEVLTWMAAESGYRHAYLSVASDAKVGPAGVYASAWADKGAVARVYEQRVLMARASATNPKAARALAELADARVRRAGLLLAPKADDPATLKKRDEGIQRAEQTIAEKEKELRETAPALERIATLNGASPADLQKVLPPGVAVVDYLKWVHFRYDPKTPGIKGTNWTAEYLAFVVTRTDLRCVSLGTAEKIDPAVAAWRGAITGDPTKTVSPASAEMTAELGAKVRDLVWAKVRKELPDGIKTVYICPDSDLCRVPWAALPGDKPGTIVLEEFAVATIPHAPFLLDRLWSQGERNNPPTGAVAVGGVKYDAELIAPPTPDIPVESRKTPLVDGKKKPGWEFLPATVGEADGVLKAAEGKKVPVELLAGEKATAAALLAALPKAKYAHLATHGFFADKQFRSAFNLDENDYEMSRRGERVGRAVNSPLVMTGLVLAGANHPKTPNRGIVTGEALVDLDLSGLELAVLSACETGLGDDVTAGEGTFGLQRAFHYAGTRNVVASLWKVNDTATAALMSEFYHQLWEKNQPPVEALRQAQLAVYRADAKKFAEMAKRGLEAGDKNLDKLPIAADTKGGNHPALWAAFILSGDGR